MKTWSMSINDSKAELKVPPDGLIAILMPSKLAHLTLYDQGPLQKAKIPILRQNQLFQI